MRWEPDELEDQIHEGLWEVPPSGCADGASCTHARPLELVAQPYGRPDHDNGKELDMKSILDPSFEYTPSNETDIRQTFARVWRELGEREESEEDPGTDRDSVWLECNGELADAGSVNIVRVRKSAILVEMVEFDCPRCKQRHESLRFR